MQKTTRVRNSNKTFFKQYLGELRVSTEFTTEEAAEVLDINTRQAYKLMSELRNKKQQSIISLTNCPVCCGSRDSELTVTVTEETISMTCGYCSAVCKVSAAFWIVSADKKYMTCSTPVRFSRAKKCKDGKRRRLFKEKEEQVVDEKFRCIQDKFVSKKALQVADEGSTSHHDVASDSSGDDFTPSQKHARFSY